MDVRLSIQKVAIDMGFGDVKVAYFEEGKIKTLKFPSYITSKGSGSNFNFSGVIGKTEITPGSSDILNYLVISVNGKQYYVGEMAKDMVLSGKEVIKYRAFSIDRDTESISEEVSKVLFRTALLTVPLTMSIFEKVPYDIEIERLTLGVPAIHFDQRIVKEKYRKIFLEDEPKEKKYRVFYLPLNKEFTFTYKRRVILLQPFGSVYNLLTEGEIKPSDIVVVVDIGYGTGDIAIMSVITEDKFKLHTAYTDTSLSISSLNQFADISSEFALKGISRLSTSEEWRLLALLKGGFTYLGKTYSFEDVVREKKRKFASDKVAEIMRTIENTAMMGMASSKLKVIITGGGAYYIGNEMAEEFKKRGLEVTLPDKPEYSNVLGFLKYSK